MQPQFRRLLIAFLAVLLIGMVIFFVANSRQKKISEIVPTPTTVELVHRGQLSLKPYDNLLRKKLGEEIIFNLTADSSGIDVVGYDVLINYKSADINLLSLTSTIPSFSVYKNQQGDKLAITGIKKLSSTESNILKGEKIISLSLKPNKKGKFTIGLMERANKETTKFVNEKTKIFYPVLNSVTIEVY